MARDKKLLSRPGYHLFYNDLPPERLAIVGRGGSVTNCPLCDKPVYKNVDCAEESYYDKEGRFYGKQIKYHGRCYVLKDPAGKPVDEWQVMPGGRKFDPDRKDEPIVIGSKTGANACLVPHHCEECSKNDECNKQEAGQIKSEETTPAPVERTLAALHYAYFGEYKGSDQGKCPICGKTVWTYKDSLAAFYDDPSHAHYRDVEWYHGKCYSKEHDLDWSTVECIVDPDHDPRKPKEEKSVVEHRSNYEEDWKAKKPVKAGKSQLPVVKCADCDLFKPYREDRAPGVCSYRPGKELMKNQPRKCKGFKPKMADDAPANDGAGKSNCCCKTCEHLDFDHAWKCNAEGLGDEPCLKWNTPDRKCDQDCEPCSMYGDIKTVIKKATEARKVKKPAKEAPDLRSLGEKILEQVGMGSHSYSDIEFNLKTDKFSLKPAVQQLVKAGLLVWRKNKLYLAERDPEVCEMSCLACPDDQTCGQAVPEVVEVNEAARVKAAGQPVEEKHVGPCRTCHHLATYPVDKDGKQRGKCTSPKATGKGRVIRNIDGVRKEGCYEPQIGAEPEKCKMSCIACPDTATCKEYEKPKKKKRKASPPSPKAAVHKVEGIDIGVCSCDRSRVLLNEDGEAWCQLCGLIYRPDESLPKKGRKVLCTPVVSLQCLHFHKESPTPCDATNEGTLGCYREHIWGHYCSNFKSEKKPVEPITAESTTEGVVVKVPEKVLDAIEEGGRAPEVKELPHVPSFQEISEKTGIPRDELCKLTPKEWHERVTPKMDPLFPRGKEWVQRSLLDYVEA